MYISAAIERFEKVMHLQYTVLNSTFQNMLDASLKS